MSATLLKTLQNITELVTTANYYLNSNEGTQLLPLQRDQLIDNITGLLASFQNYGFKQAEIKTLVTELVARKETDDHGWFIDISLSTSDQVVFIHPQRSQPAQTLVMTKSHALLPFDLLA